VSISNQFCKLHSELQSEIFGFLKPPEAAAPTCKEFNQIISLLPGRGFPIMIAARPSHFLKQIHALFEKKAGPADHPAQRGRQILDSAIDAVQKHSFVLSSKEWETAGYDPSLYGANWNFDAMSKLIRDRRCRNLISFFAKYCVPIPEAKAFFEKLSSDQTVKEKANKIRGWMAGHRDFFEEIRIQAMDEVFGLPSELLYFKHIPQFAAIFANACQHQNVELVEKMLVDPRMAEINDELFNQVYERFLADGQNSYILDLVLESPRAAALEINGSSILNAIRKKKEKVVRVYFKSMNYDEIEGERLGHLFSASIMGDNKKLIDRIIRNKKFRTIPAASLGIALCSSVNLRQGIAMNAIIQSKQFEEIGLESMIKALENALNTRFIEGVASLVNHSRSNELSPKLRQKALSFLKNSF